MFWQVGSGEKINLRSKFWWQNAVPLPSGVETVANLKNVITKDWDRLSVKIAYNSNECQQIMKTPHILVWSPRLVGLDRGTRW